MVSKATLVSSVIFNTRLNDKFVLLCCRWCWTVLWTPVSPTSISLSRTSKTRLAFPNLRSVQRQIKCFKRSLILFKTHFWSCLVQMLVYLFYAVPLVTLLLYGLKTPGCSWMLDWSIFFAGAMAQVTVHVFTDVHLFKNESRSPASLWPFRPPLLSPPSPSPQTQWCHIGASLHSRTPFTYRVPVDKKWLVIALNVLLAVAPALLALRCLSNPAFFMKPAPEEQSNNEKKEN